MKIIELLETTMVKFLTPTIAFLSHWSKGSTRALSYFTSAVKQDLKHSVTESSYDVYRGWKFSDPDDVDKIFGASHTELKAGVNLTIKQSTPHSWTKLKSEAVKFANPRFDAINKHWFDDETLTDMGYEHGDMLGISILVKANIPAQDVVADLDKIDNALLTYHDEHEIIVDRGLVTVTILDVNVHEFKMTPHHHKHHIINMTEPEWGDYHERAKHSLGEEWNELFLVKQTIPRLLRKYHLTVNAEDLIILLKHKPKQDIAMALLLKYGKKFPILKAYIIENEALFKQLYVHLTFDMILQRLESIGVLSKTNLSAWDPE